MWEREKWLAARTTDVSKYKDTESEKEPYLAYKVNAKLIMYKVEVTITGTSYKEKTYYQDWKTSVKSI